MSENMFEIATRQKLRFQSNRGVLTVEDLWDLKLTDLNDLAKALKRKLNADAEEDFLAQKSDSDKSTQLAFDLVLHVLQTKQAEADARKNAATKAAELQRLAEILNRKEDQALENLTPDEIRARMAQLQNS